MSKIIPGKNATKKDVITQKAAGLFITRGYNATSMRELAQSVGVEAPSLYNHIGSKSELLQDICSRIAGTFTTHLDEVEKQPIASTAKLESIIRFHIHMMLEQYDEVFVANHEWKHLEEPGLSEFLNRRRTYEKRLVALVEKGIQEKEFRTINPYVAVLNLLSAVRGLEFWHRHKKNVSAAELEEGMITHLLKGLIN